MRSQLLLSAVAALALTSANAADLGVVRKEAVAPVAVSPWDFTVGGGVTTNYLFRGISQTNNSPGINVNAELRYMFNDMFTGYVGTSISSIKLTNQQPSPALELDVIGGVRATLGAFTLDVGAIGYLYTNHTTGPIFPTNPTYVEGFGKLSYAFNDAFTVGANAFFSPSFLDTGARGTYLSAVAAYKLPYDFAVSGELGRQWLGGTDFVHGSYQLPDYTYWNVGASYTYKIATLDLRYHDTNLSKSRCADITGTTTGPVGGPVYSSKYCGAAIVGTLSFSLQGKDLK